LATGGGKLVLPVDAVIGDAFNNDAKQQTIDVNAGVPDGWGIYDIGAKTVDLFNKHIVGAKTVVWNGPMGVFEMANFSKGTHAVAQALVAATKAGAVTIVGGGDSAAAIEGAGLADQITHVSTGGGASLEMLEGKTLPGVAALKDK
jgi:phosphoglycerate kinase